MRGAMVARRCKVVVAVRYIPIAIHDIRDVKSPFPFFARKCRFVVVPTARN